MNKIIEIESKDIGLIQEIAHKTWPHTFADILSKKQIRYMLDIMYNSATLLKRIEVGSTFDLCYCDDIPAGFMETKIEGEGLMKIHKIYILPEYQKKSIGKSLMNRAFIRAKESGCNSITLNVNRYNKATDFYKHLGFVIVSEEDIDIGYGYLMEDYVMIKEV